MNNQLQSFIRIALDSLAQKDEFKSLSNFDDQIHLAIPKRSQHGDISCNIALKLASFVEADPASIAKELRNRLPEQIFQMVDCETYSNGFLNFRFTNYHFSSSLQKLHLLPTKNISLEKLDPQAFCKKEDVQFLLPYMHVRCTAIVRSTQNNIFNTITMEEELPLISSQTWQNWMQEYKTNVEAFEPLFDDSINEDLLATQRRLLVQIALLSLHLDTIFCEEAICQSDDETSALIYKEPICKSNDQAAKAAKIQVTKAGHDIAIRLQDYLEIALPFARDSKLFCAQLGLIVACKKFLSLTMSFLEIPVPEFM